MNKYISILEKLNNEAESNGDIPISALILKDNKIIAKAYNQKYKNNDPLAHAEILAIRKACIKLKTNNLIDCILIVTLEPCKMCQEVIKECRIKSVLYFEDNQKKINNNTIYKKIDSDADFSKKIKEFFKNKR